MARPRTLAQAPVERGGWYNGPWLTKAEADAATKRWRLRSLARQPEAGYDTLQCGGCRWFAAFGNDDGLCYNAASDYDGRVVFEHGACRQHSGARKARKDG